MAEFKPGDIEPARIEDPRAWLEWRIVQQFPPDHPRYDAFYDASDEDLAAMVHRSTGGAADDVSR